MNKADGINVIKLQNMLLRCRDIVMTSLSAFKPFGWLQINLLRLFVENVEKDQFMGSILEPHVPFSWCIVIRIFRHKGDL